MKAGVILGVRFASKGESIDRQIISADMGLPPPAFGTKHPPAFGTKHPSSLTIIFMFIIIGVGYSWLHSW